jgi:hypothetical protein
MKTVFVTFVGALAISATLPAVAGPDWQIIEHGRQVKLARMQQAAAPQMTAPVSSTPQITRRTEPANEHEKMMKACAEMMKQAQQSPSDK